MTSENRGVRDKAMPNEQAGHVNDPAEVDASTNMDPSDFRIGSREMFIQATEQTRMALCISDPHLPDCPIVYCNQSFSDLTGFDRDEIVGHNCRFLQGPETDPAAVTRLREAVDGRKFTVVEIVNYRKDGSAFWNAVHVGPIFDDDGELAYFYGSQWDITELLSEREKSLAQERVSRELRHRTDNLFAVINAMVRMSARKETDVGEFAAKVTDRIAALANAHRVSIPESPDEDGTDLHSLVEAVLKPYRNRYSDRLAIGGDAVTLAPKTVTALGLTLHELATNALKYGALGVPDGKVSVTWQSDNDNLLVDWQEELGTAARQQLEDEPTAEGGAGRMLMDGMLQSLQGRLEAAASADGYSARIELPLGQAAKVKTAAD